MKNLTLIISFLLIVYSSSAQEDCELRVKVENIAKMKGSIKIAIFNHADNFLSKEIAKDHKLIESNTIDFSFTGLEAGIYAISIFQDENENGKLDTNFMGIPTEPYGFSNNAKGMFGPPRFEDCKFEVGEGSTEVNISL